MNILAEEIKKEQNQDMAVIKKDYFLLYYSETLRNSVSIEISITYNLPQIKNIPYSDAFSCHLKKPHSIVM